MCDKNTIRCKKTHDKTPIKSCCKKHLLELLNYVTLTLEKNNIKYWLDYGTLLGATRNEKMIPWDDDCDISILMDDEEKAKKILQNNDQGYIVYWHPDYPKINTFFGVRYSEVNNLHIDIFAWKEKNGFMHRRNYLDNGPISPDAKKGKHFPKEFIQNLTKIKLEDKEYWAPDNPIEFCKFRYGKAWNIPLTVEEWNTKINNKINKIYNF